MRSSGPLAVADPSGALSGAASPAGTPVDFETLRSEIIGPGAEAATRSYAAWLARADRDASYRDVQTFVHGLRHEVLFSLSLEEVERVTSHPDPSVRTGHALGEFKKKQVSTPKVENFHTPWGFEYLAHGLLGRRGAPPRWEDFDRFLRGAARARYYEPFMRQFRYEERRPEEIERLERALRRRTGNVYYSFLREVDLLTRLRVEYGLPVRYHVLADLEYKIDLWCGNFLVALYIRNPKYREGEYGRKDRAEAKMDLSAFRTLDLELEAPTRFGRPLLVTTADVRRAAEAIRAAMASN